MIKKADMSVLAHKFAYFGLFSCQKPKTLWPLFGEISRRCPKMWVPKLKKMNIYGLRWHIFEYICNVYMLFWRADKTPYIIDIPFF